MNILDSLTVLLLKRLKPGYLKEPIFNEMQRINHCVSVEVLIKKDTRVLLQQREPDDKFWPNEWHIPGSMVRGNEVVTEALNRLIHTVIISEEKVELKGVLKKIYSYSTKRGIITHLLFELNWPGEVTGKFFSTKHLPKNTMEHHKLLLQNKL